MLSKLDSTFWLATLALWHLLIKINVSAQGSVIIFMKLNWKCQVKLLINTQQSSAIDICSFPVCYSSSCSWFHIFEFVEMHMKNHNFKKYI